MLNGITDLLAPDTAGQLTAQSTARWILPHLVVAAMVAARLFGLVMAMPMLSNGLPMRMRMLLIAAMTSVLVPSVVPVLAIDPTKIPVAELLFAGGREFIMGMIIGGVVQLLISGIQLAGELISNASGMQLAQTADPSTGQAVPQLSRLLGLVVTAILFAAGGHRMLIDALLNSFQRTPPMSVTLNQETLTLLIDHLAIGVQSGLRVAAPVIACLLLTNLVVALISRMAPQLNVLAIGLNINVMAGLVVMAITVGSAGLVFETELSSALTRLGETLATRP
ncbi:flagellar biosynthetic protein FliR [Stieleria sp. TO1_6]|uniref:flagellar biosynthetic protein FliR n=1 Tax=Stieleria tagensis TaxID=2956795 RepID=UPI00209AB93C|nr:flagellar biosynthetic protein FliR [Stieleria tagensis]MCO8120340.1 flagellar biosynthetic protein FliR [Stieleria tagensis]